MSKNEGKVFEENIKTSLDNNIVWCYRPPDTSTSWGGGMASRFTSQSHCDLFVHIPYDISCNGISFYTIELKSTKSTSIPFVPYVDFFNWNTCSNLVQELSSNIKEYKTKLKRKTLPYDERESISIELYNAENNLKEKKKELKEYKKLLSSKSIKYHQIKNMFDDCSYDNVKGGFIFNFRNKDNDTFYLDGFSFRKWWTKTEKKSINIKDIKELGGIRIESKQINKSKNYEYEFNGLLYLIK